jgi:hypothetical protein
MRSSPTAAVSSGVNDSISGTDAGCSGSGLGADGGRLADIDLGVGTEGALAARPRAD